MGPSPTKPCDEAATSSASNMHHPDLQNGLEKLWFRKYKQARFSEKIISSNLSNKHFSRDTAIQEPIKFELRVFFSDPREEMSWLSRDLHRLS